MIFPNPDMGMIVERLPSTQVPYGLWDTLGYFVARTANPYVVKPSYNSFLYIVV